MATIIEITPRQKVDCWLCKYLYLVTSASLNLDSFHLSNLALASFEVKRLLKNTCVSTSSSLNGGALFSMASSSLRRKNSIPNVTTNIITENSMGAVTHLLINGVGVVKAVMAMASSITANTKPIIVNRVFVMQTRV